MSRPLLTITAEVRAVIEAGTITDAKFVLPATHLDRALYMATNKVLEAAGGKWDRKAKAHVFESTAYLKESLKGNTIVDREKEKKKDLNAFFTPPGVAVFAVGYLGCGPGASVLEPSAGEGALALAANNEGFDVTCIDVDTAFCATLRGLGLEEFNGDFLNFTPESLAKLTANNPKGGKFDAVLMNPPFSKGREVDHVVHALNFLKRGGRLVSIMSKAFTYRDDARYTHFRQVFAMHNGTIRQELPSGTFRESGTDIATVIITLDK